MTLIRKITSIGFGNMAKALLNGAVKAGAISQDNLLVSSPSLWLNPKLTHYAVAANNRDAAKNADIIILATKPNMIPTVCKEIADSINNNTLIVSIAAGISTHTIQQNLRCNDVPIIRIMPNTPVSIGLGTSGFYKNQFVTASQAQEVTSLLESTGIVIPFNNEDDINKITAISGSGPAYFFSMLHDLTEAGKEIGLSEADTIKALKQTILGASTLINTNELTFKEAQQKVTSKGGTTAAAIQCFTEGGMKKILSNGVHAAYRRAIEMSEVKEEVTPQRFFQPDAGQTVAVATTLDENSVPTL